MARLDRSPFRASHPDDVLRKLARSGRPILPSSMGSSYRPPGRRSSTVVAIWVLLLGTVVLAALPFVWPRHDINVTGLTSGEHLSAATAAQRIVTVSVKPASATAQAKVTLDGVTVPARVVGAELTFTLGPMNDGQHHITVTSGTGLLLRGPASRRIPFVIDSTPPTLADLKVSAPSTLASPVTVSGTTDPETVVRVNGVEVTADGAGAFVLELARPPVGALRITARDRAGNVRSEKRPPLAAPLMPQMRGVHVSHEAWADPERKAAVLAMADAGRITTVEFDLKDEDGKIGHVSAVPLVNQLGASRSLYDLKSVVSELHSRKVFVIGRLVAFRDPLLVEAAMRTNHPEQVVQNISGAPFDSKTGQWTNMGNRTVRNYNSAIALEAALAGVDAIMLDYVGAPEGELDKMRFPGLETVSEPIVSAKTIVTRSVYYLNATAQALASTSTRLGLSVPGAIIRSKATPAGSTRRLAETVDFLAPTIFPSTFKPGSFDIADPPARPGDIAERATQAFQEALGDVGVRLVPRLQDFSLIRDYKATQVRAQIDGVAKRCVSDFLLWDAKVTYHADGLPESAAVGSGC